MDYIWNEFLKHKKTDEEKLNALRELRDGMKWGTQEHGIPQLSETTLFLLRILDERQN